MKLISVPLTREAMNRLNYNQCIPGDLEELELDDDVYREIWSTNFFNVVNRELDKNIDDYEDENICDNNRLNRLLNIISRYIHIHIFFRELYLLVKLALNSNTGIFFLFLISKIFILMMSVSKTLKCIPSFYLMEMKVKLKLKNIKKA